MIKKYIQYIRENIEYLEEEDEEDIDDSFIIDKKFRQFLIDNNCLEEYAENCENETNLNSKLVGASLLRYGYAGTNWWEHVDERDHIMNAFYWGDTPQGDLYWNDINYKWNKKIEELNYDI